MAMADTTKTPSTMGHTVVGVFDGQQDAEKALNALKDAGFTPDQVSVVAKDTRETASMVERSDMGGAETSGIGTGALLGGLFGGAAGWLVGIGALAIPGIGPIVAAGALATTLGGAAGGAAAGPPRPLRRTGLRARRLRRGGVGADPPPLARRVRLRPRLVTR